MADPLLTVMIVIGCVALILSIVSICLYCRPYKYSIDKSARPEPHAFESSIEKAIRIVGLVRGDLESTVAWSCLPQCARQRAVRTQITALRDVESLLADPMPLHMPDILQAVQSGEITADKEIKAWLSYELANRASMIDNWLVGREQFLKVQMQKKRPSRSPSIISMRDTTQLATHLQSICSWEFDVFSLVDQNAEELPLAAVGFCLFLKHDLFNRLHLDMDKVETLMATIDDSYSRNPYHCNLHGAEVAQTVSYMLTSGGFYQLLKPTDVTAMILAALCHDIAHPGQTNQYHIMTQSELALRYNNIAVLENFHAAFARKLMRKAEANILENLDRQLAKEVDELLISVILATDMSTNFECCAKFRRSQASAATVRRGSTRSASIDPVDAQTICAHKESFYTMMQMLMKCADVSHCVKKWEIHKRFSDMITDEFYAQGDLERQAGIPISPYMDRNIATNTAKNQVGFFQFLVQPAWQTWLSLCPVPGAETNLQSNMREWERLSSIWAPVSESIIDSSLNPQPLLNNDTHEDVNAENDTKSTSSPKEARRILPT